MLFSILEKQHFSLLGQAVFFLPAESLLFLPLVSGSEARPSLHRSAPAQASQGSFRLLTSFLSPFTHVSTLSPNLGIVLFFLIQRDEATWWY